MIIIGSSNPIPDAVAISFILPLILYNISFTSNGSPPNHERLILFVFGIILFSIYEIILCSVSSDIALNFLVSFS